MLKIFAMATVTLATPAFADLAYTFDTDTQGWGTLNDATGFVWDGTDGSPNPGYIRARDIGNGQIWYFSAPQADLGNFSNSYGGTISWDILGITGNQASFGDRADVMLVGGGISIGIVVGTQPVNGQWTSWSADVNDSSGWKIVSSLSSGVLTGTDASQSDIQTVLGDLQGFYIQGEYTNGGDSSGIDNVLFTVPAPGAAALFSLGGMVGLRRKR